MMLVIEKAAYRSGQRMRLVAMEVHTVTTDLVLILYDFYAGQEWEEICLNLNRENDRYG